MRPPVRTTLAMLTDALRVDSPFGHPMDLDSDIHEGFTVGSGKTMYWMYTISKWGNFTVYPKSDANSRRWLLPDQEITVHYKTG